MKQEEALQTLGDYHIVYRHDDGDLTVRSDSEMYVVTTEGQVFKEVKMPLTDQEIREISTRVADEVIAKIPSGLMVHIMEHEVLGSGRVIDPARARATGCKCFEFEGEEYCWSPGVLGLISSKKNPEQLEEYCVVGKEPAGAGAQQRFAEIKGAISEAHQEWRRNGEGLPSWWEKVGKKLAEKGITL